MSQSQQKKHDEFTATFLNEETQKWQNMVKDWNANRKAMNPYIEPVASKYASVSIHYHITHF